MARENVGNGYIRAPAGTLFTLRMTSKFGAVISVRYEMVQVESPPRLVDGDDWNEQRFQQANPQVRPLPAALAPGRYLSAVVPALQAPKTELEIEILQGAQVVYRRTAYADQHVREGVSIFTLILN